MLDVSLVVNRFLFWALVAASACASLASAQEPQRRLPQRDEPRSLDLAINNVGLSIGNSRRHTGLRLNWRDEGLIRANGINATLWMPGDSPRGEINGVSVGLVAPGAARLNGDTVARGGIARLTIRLKRAEARLGLEPARCRRRCSSSSRSGSESVSGSFLGTVIFDFTSAWR